MSRRGSRPRIVPIAGSRTTVRTESTIRTELPDRTVDLSIETRGFVVFMRGLKVTLSVFGLVAGIAVGWILLVAMSQPVRVNYAYVVGRYNSGFWWSVREYLPFAVPVVGALVGWIVALLLVRAGWRMTRER